MAGTESAVQIRMLDANGRTAWRHAERGGFLGEASLLVGPGSNSAISGQFVPAGAASLVWDFGTGEIRSRQAVSIGSPFFKGERPMAFSSGEVGTNPRRELLNVVDLTTGAILNTAAPMGFVDPILFMEHMSVSADGLICASSSLSSAEIYLWDIGSGQLRPAIRRNGIPDGPDLKALSNDGKMLAARDGADIVVWELGGDGSKEVGRFHAEPVAIGFGESGDLEKTLTVVDNAGRVLEWRPGLSEAKSVSQLEKMPAGHPDDWFLTRDRRAAVRRSRQSRNMNVSVHDVKSGARLRQWDLNNDQGLDAAPGFSRYPPPCRQLYLVDAQGVGA